MVYKSDLSSRFYKFPLTFFIPYFIDEQRKGKMLCTFVNCLTHSSSKSFRTSPALVILPKQHRFNWRIMYNWRHRPAGWTPRNVRRVRLTAIYVHVHTPTGLLWYSQQFATPKIDTTDHLRQIQLPDINKGIKYKQLYTVSNVQRWEKQWCSQTKQIISR